jgi:hypothetical protein
MAWHIRTVPDKELKGRYWGMNYYAKKELGEHIPIKKNEILVSDKCTPTMRRRTIAHEKLEADMMNRRGFKYAKAHKVAEAMDDYV